MLQLNYMDVAYDSIVLKACCNSMFLSVLDISMVCFVCVFQTHVSIVYFGCYICSTHMLHVCLFGCLLIVAMIFKCVSGVFSQVFHKYISTVFRLMLQLLFLAVLKVDRVFYLPSRFFYCITSVPPPLLRRLGICRPYSLSLNAGDVWDGAGPVWVRIHRRMGLAPYVHVGTCERERASLGCTAGVDAGAASR